MKTLQNAILILFLCALTANAQTIVRDNPSVAKNDPETSEKKVTTAATTGMSVADKAPASGPAKTLTDAEVLNRAGAQVQQTNSLTLDEAIRKALENNNEIEVSRQSVKIAESSLRSLLGIYDPVFTLSPTYRDVVQPVTSSLGGGGSQGSTSTKQFFVDSNVQHFIKPGGGSYNVFFNNDRSSSSATFSQFTPTYSTALGVNYTQPLFRNFRIDANRRAIKIQRKRISQSDADFRTRTIDTINSVQNAYWNLVFALRDQQNKQENLELSRENLRQVKAKIDAGRDAPLAEYEVLTELANRQTDLINAVELVANTENTLKRLLIRDPASPEWATTIVPADRPIIGDDTVNLDAVVKDAIANRPELARLRIEREVNDIDIQFFKNQMKPRVDLNTAFSLSGIAGTPTGNTGTLTAPIISGDPNFNANAYLLSQVNVLRLQAGLPIITAGQIPQVPIESSVNPIFVGGYDRSLRNLLSTDFRNFQVGVTIEFPLRNKTAKADLATAQAQRTQLEANTRANEQTVIVEVRNAVQALEASRQRVLTAREAVKNAEEQLKGQRTLYELGRSDTFLLFQRENQLALAKNLLIRAETDYTKAVADLQRATSVTLVANNITIASPVETVK